MPVDDARPRHLGHVDKAVGSPELARRVVHEQLELERVLRDALGCLFPRLLVECGGSREDKVEAAFSLYDLNGDGFISLEEMTTYLTSVFKVLYETQPETRARMGVSAEELAAPRAAAPSPPRWRRG